MSPPTESSASSNKPDDNNQSQTSRSFNEMEQANRDDHASSVDSMATASTMRPSAIPNPSSGTTPHHRESKSRRIERERHPSTDTDSSLGGIITPRSGQFTSDYLLSGTGGSSFAWLEKPELMRLFHRDMEGLEQKIESTPQYEMQKSPLNAPAEPFSNSCGPLPMKTPIFDQLRRDRQSSGSSTFTNEPPGLTASSRATTFDEPLPPLEEITDLNQVSESPPNTSWLSQRILSSKSFEDEARTEHNIGPSPMLTKEPTRFCKSPLRRTWELGNCGTPRYEGHRSPQPLTSDSGESEIEDNVFHISVPFSQQEADSDDEESFSDSECSEEPEEIDESHPLYEIKGAVVRQALLDYQNWKTSAPGSSNGTSAPNQSFTGSQENASNARRGSAKRQREENNNDDGDENGRNEPPPKKQAPSPESSSSKEPVWACPFAKMHHARWEKCYSKVLRRIKDVKQHLERVHMAKAHCDRCRQTFPGEAERVAHSRQQEGCNVNDAPLPEGINSTQLEKLKKRVKAKTWNGQWYEIFEICFEGAPRPQSPFVPKDLAEKLRGFMDMMHERGTGIIMDKITQRGLISQLEGMGLNATEDDKQTISTLLSASIADGFVELTNAWKLSSSGTRTEPPLTDGGTAQSIAELPEGQSLSTQLGEVSSTETPILLLAPMNYTSHPTKGGDLAPQDAGQGDVVYLYSDGSSMQTPNLNGGIGGEWTNVEFDAALQDILQKAPGEEPMDSFVDWNGG